jgi:hypothetical protein
MAQCHQGRHARARGQAGHIDTLGVQTMPRHFRLDQRRDQIGLGAAMGVVGLEPPPAALHLARHGLLRIQHHEAASVRPLVHAGATRERQRGLATAMQHHHQGHARGRRGNGGIARKAQLAPLTIGKLSGAFPAPATQRGGHGLTWGSRGRRCFGRRLARRRGPLARGLGRRHAHRRALQLAQLLCRFEKQTGKTARHW